jgi:RimJ/RimL family protein N-acetyltransferase
MHRLTSRVFPENVATRVVLKRLEFEEIGDTSEARIIE